MTPGRRTRRGEGAGVTRRPQRPTDGRRKGRKGRGAKTAVGRGAKPASKFNTRARQLKPKPSQTRGVMEPAASPAEKNDGAS